MVVSLDGKVAGYDLTPLEAGIEKHPLHKPPLPSDKQGARSSAGQARSTERDGAKTISHAPRPSPDPSGMANPRYSPYGREAGRGIAAGWRKTAPQHARVEAGGIAIATAACGA